MAAQTRQGRGRRWRWQVIASDVDGRAVVWWCAWWLYERVEGTAVGLQDAMAAIDHFLTSEHHYTLTRRGQG